MPFEFSPLPPAGRPDRKEPGVRIRDLHLASDVPLLHRWFQQPSAVFWGMQGTTEADTLRHYAAMNRSDHARAFVGIVAGERSFVVELYDPAFDAVAEHYPVRAGDLGMHFFVGPATRPQSGFTRRVFRSIMNLAFDHFGAQRVVVEPDVRNERVHALNRDMGFVVHKEIALPHKRAQLAFCTRTDHLLATHKELLA